MLSCSGDSITGCVGSRLASASNEREARAHDLRPAFGAAETAPTTRHAQTHRMLADARLIREVSRCFPATPLTPKVSCLQVDNRSLRAKRVAQGAWPSWSRGALATLKRDEGTDHRLKQTSSLIEHFYWRSITRAHAPDKVWATLQLQV